MLLVRVIAAFSILIIFLVASAPFWTDTKDLNVVSSADIDALTKSGVAMAANVSANFSGVVPGGSAIASAFTSDASDRLDAPAPDGAYSTLRPIRVASLAAPRRPGDFDLCDPPAAPRGVRSIYLFQSAPAAAEIGGEIGVEIGGGSGMAAGGEGAPVGAASPGGVGATGARDLVNSPREVEVLIEGSDPVYLLLASEEPVLWRFSGAVGSAVGVVIVEAPAGGSEVLGIPRPVVSVLDQDCARAPGEGERPDDGLAWDGVFDEVYERSSPALIAFPGGIGRK